MEMKVRCWEWQKRMSYSFVCSLAFLEEEQRQINVHISGEVTLKVIIRNKEVKCAYKGHR
jgi:hypothetical protein